MSSAISSVLLLMVVVMSQGNPGPRGIPGPKGSKGDQVRTIQHGYMHLHIIYNIVVPRSLFDKSHLLGYVNQIPLSGPKRQKGCSTRTWQQRVSCKCQSDACCKEWNRHFNSRTIENYDQSFPNMFCVSLGSCWSPWSQRGHRARGTWGKSWHWWNSWKRWA